MKHSEGLFILHYCTYMLSFVKLNFHLCSTDEGTPLTPITLGGTHTKVLRNEEKYVGCDGEGTEGR